MKNDIYVKNTSPTLDPSKECEKTFLTFLAKVNYENANEFACADFIIPSSACSDELNSLDCYDPRLQYIITRSSYG